MSRIERLREYQNPQHGPQGAGRDKANIDYWSARAEENSTGADHRATGTERAEAHSTGKKPVDRPTEMLPRTLRKVDAAMAGKNDLNHVGGSDYMKSIRRDA
jgi:hypothetical protein